MCVKYCYQPKHLYELKVKKSKLMDDVRSPVNPTENTSTATVDTKTTRKTDTLASTRNIEHKQQQNEENIQPKVVLNTPEAQQPIGSPNGSINQSQAGKWECDTKPADDSTLLGDINVNTNTDGMDVSRASSSGGSRGFQGFHGTPLLVSVIIEA